MRGIINRYQHKIDQISIKYLTDFGRILKYISWINLNISQISVDSGQREKIWKKAENSHVSTGSNSRISRIYQRDIEAFCTPDIMSCYRLVGSASFSLGEFTKGIWYGKAR